MRRPPFRPWFECLEERTNPGVVTASFAAGTLTLTGSTGADSVAVNQPSFGQITLTGNGTTTFRLGSTGPVVTGPVTFGSAAAPVKNFNANLGVGNDTFFFNIGATPINLSGSFAVDLGSGNDSINGAPGQSFNLGGNFTIQAGAGNDSVGFGDFNVAGNVTWDLGDGINQQLFLSRVALPTNLFVGGSLALRSGVGNESINFSSVDVTGLTTVSTGSGNVVTGLNAQVNVGVGGSSMTLNGGLQIFSAASDTGIDSITFTATALTEIHGPPTGGLNVQTYGGNDVVIINDLVNTAGTIIATGAGDDSVNIDGPNVTATFAGPFQVNTGDGNDTLEIGNAGAVDFLNSVSVQMGAGNDSLTLATTGPVGFSAGFLAVFDGGGGLIGGFNQKTTNAANITGPLPQIINFF